MSPRTITLTLNPAVDLRQHLEQPQLRALNRAQQASFEPSGKGVNVARALHEQGRPVTAVAPLGGVCGAYIQETLAAQGVPLRACPIAGETRLNVKVAEASGATTEFNSPGPMLSRAELLRVWAALQDEAQPGSAAGLSGSLPPGVPTDLYAHWTRELQARGVRVWLDTGGEALRAALSARPFLIKPNREEAQALLGRAIATQAEALSAAVALRQLGAQRVVLSLGAQGAVFLGEQAVLAVPPTLSVRSTVGCGDALLAAFMAALERGESWREAACWATAYAAARAGHSGPTFGDLGRARALYPQVHLQVWPSVPP